jgi:hypothetical protein
VLLSLKKHDCNGRVNGLLVVATCRYIYFTYGYSLSVPTSSIQSLSLFPPASDSHEIWLKSIKLSASQLQA